jgi:hypothetical protein
VAPPDLPSLRFRADRCPLKFSTCPERYSSGWSASVLGPQGRDWRGRKLETKEKVMSDNTKTNETTNSKTPSHVAYHVRDRGENQKAFWTRIGSAWAHKDGNGFNVQLECIPLLDGRITLRVASEKKE